MEMVESVAGAENSLREKTGSNPKKQTSNRWAPSETETLAATEPTDHADAPKPTVPPSPKATAIRKDHVGLQIDMTA
ncbi:hypothetical protein HZA56_12670 [Candidatus Poribacteria bacterium]|nr:hypothetical protein [Candidatus Poribacteria bacterium]